MKIIMEEKYLPIGTIVTITEQPKKIVIVGYGAFEKIPGEETPTIYDYCGYPYPEGYCGNQNIIIFNHEDITEILYKGYISDTYSTFNNQITEHIENYQKRSQ